MNGQTSHNARPDMRRMNGMGAGFDARASRGSAQSIRRGRTRILIYTMNYRPEPTGAGRYSGELGTYLSREGIEVSVVTTPPHYPGWAPRNSYRNRYCAETIDGVRVFRCPLVLRRKMSGIWRLIAPLSFALTSAPIAVWRILVDRPKTVVCVEPTLLVAPLALLCAAVVGARTVLHVQDLEVEAAFAVGHLKGHACRKVAEMFDRLVTRSFGAVVTISNKMCRRMAENGVPADRLSVVRNWVNLDELRPLGRHSRYRAELGLPDNAFVALYAGNVGAKQALPVMLEAAEALAHLPHLFFVVAGDGPEKPHLITRFGHRKNVVFLPTQPEAQLCELLNLADVHVLPQHRTVADLVLPSKLGGMLATGKECIVMADPGTELYEFFQGAAILVPPGRSDLLATAIEGLVVSKPDAVRAAPRHTRVLQLDAKRNLPMFREILFPQ